MAAKRPCLARLGAVSRNSSIFGVKNGTKHRQGACQWRPISHATRLLRHQQQQQQQQEAEAEAQSGRGGGGGGGGGGPSVKSPLTSSHIPSPRTKYSSIRLNDLKGSPKAKAKRLSVSVDGHFTTYDYIFLRDACTCPRCVDPSTRQKSFNTADIPQEITARQAIQSPTDGSIQIHWANDIPGFSSSPPPPNDEAPHITTLTPEFLRANVSARNRVRARYNNPRRVLWDAEIMAADATWLDYSSYLESDETLHAALRALTTYGLLFLSNVPSSPSAVENIATRIGPIRDTFYGRTWDVKSVAAAKNVAYTHQYLGLHMDLLYMQAPPRLQFLHSLRSSCTGGQSLFADSFRAAHALRLGNPHAFRCLETFPVTYHYRNDNQHYHFTRPTIELDPYPASAASPSSSGSASSSPSSSSSAARRISHVNYSPPFQAPFEADIGTADNGYALRGYLRAIRDFQSLAASPDAVFELRLEEGQCVVFDNRRVLHARRAFDVASGERWLKGAYLDQDPFLSRWRVLEERFGAVAAAGAAGTAANGGRGGRVLQEEEEGEEYEGGDEHI
ncbi:MAG: hypothetical protein M1819_002968 [Sarea resinae]|nr:MAG: hypothetical protein M1819_002968 [Sarea resinae]